MILKIYKDSRTVFTFKELAFMMEEENASKLKQKINYQVRKQNLLNLRKGIYAKPDYNKEELASKIYVPCYLSLDYVLQKSGAIFQYTAAYTVVSYLSRKIQVYSVEIHYRKIKEPILLNTLGIDQLPNGINIATKERAILDYYYLEKDFYLDHPGVMDKKRLKSLLPLYQSVTLEERIRQNFSL